MAMNYEFVALGADDIQITAVGATIGRPISSFGIQGCRAANGRPYKGS